jgi:hypothetical protein
MVDVNYQIINQLWNATEFSTWDSLLSNLDEIHQYDIITTNQWEDLNYAIRKLASLETPFPDSPGELAQLLDTYM